MTSSTDMSSDFRVRGGGTDEVLVLFDGAELPEPYHFKALSGLLGVVDAETIDSLVLMSGAFPSRYGNKLSGVLAFESHTPRGPSKTSIGINTLNMNAKTQGTFGEGRGSYLIDARSGYLDVALRFVDPEDEDQHRDVDFFDVFGKISYRISDFHSITHHVLYAEDGFDDSEESDSTGGLFEATNTHSNSLATWMNLNSFWTDSLASRSVASYFSSQTDESGFDNIHVHNIDLEYHGNYDIFQFKQDWEWTPNERHFFRFGWSLRFEDATQDYYSERRIVWPTIFRRNQGITDCSVDGSSRSFGLYLSDQVDLSDRLTADFGLRYDRQDFLGEDQISPPGGDPGGSRKTLG